MLSRYAPIAASIAAALSLATVPLAAPAAAQAQETAAEDDEAALPIAERAAGAVAVMRGEREALEVFSPTFLAAVSEAQLRALTAQLEAQFGPLQGVDSLDPVDARRARIVLRFERGLGSGGIELAPTAPYLIDGLRLSSFEPLDDSAEAIETELSDLPGEVSVWFGPLGEGEARFSRNPDALHPIGSTFKLYVLSTLARSVEAGERGWDDVVPLSVRSLPSGIMHDWPQGAPVTLHTLATLMISGSDNTATDQLIAVLGRDAVEAEVRAAGHSDPAATLPFLTTLEMFALKSDLERGQAYAAADEAARRAQLARLDAERGGTSEGSGIAPWTEARLIDDVEWFASTADLRALLARIAQQDDATARRIMSVAPAMPPAIADRWDYIGYKGGSEPGVLNYSWLLRDGDGDWHALVMSWKDESNTLSTSLFDMFAQRLIALPEG